jgi:hypothetical protein
MAAIGTRKMKIQMGTPPVEYNTDLSRAEVTSGETDSDFVSFADAAAGGGRDYALEFTAVQDASTASLWSEVWDNAGSELDVTLVPYGNDTPSAAEPHFTMTAVVSEPDGTILGGEADASTTAKFTFECEWKLTAKPERVTTGA